MSSSKKQHSTRADNLLNPHQLEPGKLYAMVVSDAYGLRRYQTDDLFLCKRKLNGLPDLAFVRRRSLEYSFTGEKLTAEQLTTVFEQLRAMYPSLLADRFLTCVPTQSSGAVPHYQLLLLGDQPSTSTTSHDDIATRCDELLSEINCEYRSKRSSGRLGPIKCSNVEIRDFAERFGNNVRWETQFKFLPLIRLKSLLILCLACLIKIRHINKNPLLFSTIFLACRLLMQDWKSICFSYS